MNIEERLKAIDARLDKSTPGEWYPSHYTKSDISFLLSHLKKCREALTDIRRGGYSGASYLAEQALNPGEDSK